MSQNNYQIAAIIDTAGQWTPIIKGNFLPEEKSKIGQELLALYPLAGQVAFINNGDISMMGGELSINGTIAANYYLRGQISNTPSLFQWSFPQNIISNILDKEVIFAGIKYKLTKQFPTKIIARNYCNNDPACGYILENNPSEIIPIIYVKATDTLIRETACGSASLAYSLLTKNYQITQVSGKIITITVTQNSYLISLDCQVVKL